MSSCGHKIIQWQIILDDTKECEFLEQNGVVFSSPFCSLIVFSFFLSFHRKEIS